MSDINLRRISIRGGKFTLVVDGTEVSTDDSGSIEVVVVNAAPVSRSFYGDAYDPNRVAVPTCWSSDTQLPSREVPQDQRQAMRCMDCPQNIRGSGQLYLGISPMRCISYRYLPHQYSGMIEVALWVCRTMRDYYLNTIPQ